MRLKFSLCIALLTLLICLIPLYGVDAQEPTPSDDEVNAIARQLYCPVCDNVPLDVCPTKACDQWRGIIREKLALGWDEDQIKEYFVAQYGDGVLATPPAKGLNWLVYILPPSAILIGAVILFSAFRSRTTGTEEEKSSITIEKEILDNPYIARLEEELRRREGS